MAQPGTSSYTVSDFLQWQGAKQLQLAAKFQRRSVWVEKAKSYLIDTMIREKPIPPIFLRLRIDLSNRRTLREVVDGQQRIRTVLSYVAGEFPILKAHNEALQGKYFADLSPELQERILQYTFFVFTLQNVSDEDVLDIFARFNTYSVALNAQELRNAKFTGVFKRTAYTLAHRYNKFWVKNGIFTDRQITRMLEVEFVSELIGTMLNGIVSTSKRELDRYYEDYDDEFSLRERFSGRFEQVINIIGDMFGDRLAGSIFHRKPLFFSLFIAVYSLRFGLPGEVTSKIKFSASQIESIVQRLIRFEQAITRDDPPARYRDFISAMNRATANQGNRALRHDLLSDIIFSATN